MLGKWTKHRQILTKQINYAFVFVKFKYWHIRNWCLPAGTTDWLMLNEYLTNEDVDFLFISSKYIDNNIAEVAIEIMIAFHYCWFLGVIRTKFHFKHKIKKMFYLICKDIKQWVKSKRKWIGILNLKLLTIYFQNLYTISNKFLFIYFQMSSEIWMFV